MSQCRTVMSGIYTFLSKRCERVKTCRQSRGYRPFTKQQNRTFKRVLDERIGVQIGNFDLGHVVWAFLGMGIAQKGKLTSWGREKSVANRITLAEMAIKDGDLKMAENLLEEALKIGDSTETVGITCVYDMLATIAYRQGDISRAESILIEVVGKLIEKGMASNHNTVINFSLKLARIYSNDGQDDLAELGFRNCLAIQKKKYMSGETDEETAMLWVNTLFWYGKFLAIKERFAEAKQCFDSAYTMCAHVKSIDTNQVMVMLYNLGEMSFATGDLEGALKHLLNAVILGKATNSPDLPSYYTRIGLIYIQKGVYGEAGHWCRSGIDAAYRLHDKKASGEAEDCIKQLQTLFEKA